MDKTKNPIARAAIHLFLIVFTIYSILPFYWTLMQSIKKLKDANSRTPKFIFTPTWGNYQELWLERVPENGYMIMFFILLAVVLLICLALFAEHIPVPNWVSYVGVCLGFAAILWGIPEVVQTAEFYDYFINTIIVTVGTVVVSITIGCLAGYSLARYSGYASVVVLIGALAFRALPRLAFTLPYYQIGSALNLLDTRFLVIITLVAVNQPFTIWMLRSFFMDIPKDLEESAMVDGASRLVAFRKVIIPIMWPGIISAALFTLLLAYNEFLMVRILTHTNWTLPVAISRYTGGEDPRHLTLAAAAAVSATIPIVIVILFFQKNLVKGLAAGAVKG
ncbi:MAG: ABC-type glycerol-3-phosphate transport system permease component [Cellvibrionaceae bacterium]|jgi:ABC-type glycerol-3-phosphate transport system permease component